MTGYDVVVCADCGAGYSDNIPSQPAFDSYYAAMSKYEHGQRDGGVSSLDEEIFRQAADLLEPHVKHSEAIADIGCATGSFLGELKRRGFKNLMGFDPSLACCHAGRQRYGLEMRQATINQLRDVAERFDVVILTGVLEHLCDVESSLTTLIGLLKPDGRLFIAVPDASHYHRWFGGPYQFFSMEHVNFFGPQSLANLMTRLGFSTVFIERLPRHLGPNSVEPVIMGLFQCAVDFPALTSQTLDHETGAGLRAYIEVSRAVETRISFILAGIAESKVPLVVWGAGTHTLRLLETSPLARANIVAIIDSNKNYHGKRLNGIPIIPPAEWRDPAATVLISSQVAEQEIKNQITNSLRWKNRVVCLYEDARIRMLP